MATTGTAVLAPAPFLALFWATINTQAALSSVITGELTVVMTTYLWKNPMGLSPGLWGLAVDPAVIVAVSLFTRPDVLVEEAVFYLRDYFMAGKGSVPTSGRSASTV